MLCRNAPSAIGFGGSLAAGRRRRLDANGNGRGERRGMDAVSFRPTGEISYFKGRDFSLSLEMTRHACVRNDKIRRRAGRTLPKKNDILNANANYQVKVLSLYIFSILSLLMRARKVLRSRPRISAALFFPLTFHLVSSRTCRM